MHGQEVGQNLGGVGFVGQAVPHGHVRELGQGFHDGLGVAAVFNAVVHLAEHAGGVGHGFFLAHLGAGGAKVGAAGALVETGHFKGATGTGGVFFKKQHDVLVIQELLFLAQTLVELQLRGKAEQIHQLVGTKVVNFQKVLVSQADVLVHVIIPP